MYLQDFSDRWICYLFSKLSEEKIIIKETNNKMIFIFKFTLNHSVEKHISILLFQRHFRSSKLKIMKLLIVITATKPSKSHIIVR